MAIEKVHYSVQLYISDKIDRSQGSMARDRDPKVRWLTAYTSRRWKKQLKY